MMRSRHQSQQIARLSPGGSSMAGGPHGLLLQWGSPVTIIHDQMATQSRGGGLPRGACSVLPPARGQGAGLPRVGRVADGFSRRLTLPRNTGRGFGSGAFCKFGLRGRCSAHLARFHAHGDRAFQSLRQGLPSHFICLRRGENTKPREASDYVPHTIGEVRNV
jgi:hypothetical protein